MTSAVQSVPQFIAMLQTATPTEAADILAALDRGLPLWTARQEAAAVTATVTEVTPVKSKIVKAPAAPKKEKVVKEKAAPKEKVVVALPEASAGAPDASEYRMAVDSWDAETCIARITKGGDDKRWKPIIFRESQCGGKVVEGSDLCAKCCKREEKYAADPKAGDWCGRLTEEPLDWQHMLGTAWAEEKKPKFLGAAGSGAVSSAVSVADEEEPKAKPADKPADKLAAKEAAKAAKDAEKEAAKAAKEAAAAAAKEAAKAAKEAEKAAAKVAKEAAKEAAKVAKEPKVAKAVKAKKEAVVAVAPVIAVEGELKCIDGTMYEVKKGNVYEYDELTEKAGDFVGRLTGDETIDTEAEEITVAESDTD